MMNTELIDTTTYVSYKINLGIEVMTNLFKHECRLSPEHYLSFQITEIGVNNCCYLEDSIIVVIDVDDDNEVMWQAIESLIADYFWSNNLKLV